MPINLTCDHCGTAFRRPLSQIRKANYCSKACAYAARIKVTPTARRMAYRPEHPLADSAGYAAEHRMIVFDRLGAGPHPCHWCGAAVDWMPGHRTVKGALVVDHVDGDELNNAPDNLVPSCQRCNVWRKRQDHLVSDNEVFVQNGPTRLRAEQRACATCGKTFLFAPSRDARPNAGKYCSRECLWHRNK